VDSPDCILLPTQPFCHTSHGAAADPHAACRIVGFDPAAWAPRPTIPLLMAVAFHRTPVDETETAARHSRSRIMMRCGVLIQRHPAES